MTKRKKKSTKTKQYSTMWVMTYNSAIQGLTAAAGYDAPGVFNDTELTEQAASIVRRAEKIAEIAEQRLT